MLNILLIDDWLLNNKVIEQDSSEYFEDNNIKYNFFEATNPQNAFEILQKNKIDIVYVDISSEKFDGIQLLKDILVLDESPIEIIAVTVLYDKKYRNETLKLGIDKYIYKPYDYLEIKESLEKFFKNHNEFKEENKDDSFDFDFDEEKEIKIEEKNEDAFDFDFDLDEEEPKKEENKDDSFDFDFDLNEEETPSQDKIEHSQELMDEYNKTHKKVSSQEFLAEYADVSYDTDDLVELEEDLDNLVSNILFDSDLDGKIPDIVYILEKYNRFLYSFSEFEELCKVIYVLVELLNKTDFHTLKSKKMAAKLIIAIIEDLVDWKEHVFIKEDAVDVFYINASILNSFILLKNIVNK